jgi:hypothetical protein
VIAEELTVEFLHPGLQHMRPGAEVHGFPELADIVSEGFRVLLALLQHLLEGFLRQQADVLGEHREQAAHQEHRHVLRRIVLLLQCERDLREAFGDVARDPGRGLRRIERFRGEPDLAQPIANVADAEVFEINAKGLAVRELGVVLALSGKIRIDLDAVADVADQDEGRPAVRGRQRAGVFLRLPLGVEHQHVPGAVRAMLPGFRQ